MGPTSPWQFRGNTGYYRHKTRVGQHHHSDLAIDTALTLSLILGLRLHQAEVLDSVLQLMVLAADLRSHASLNAVIRASPGVRMIESNLQGNLFEARKTEIKEIGVRLSAAKRNITHSVILTTIIWAPQAVGDGIPLAGLPSLGGILLAI